MLQQWFSNSDVHQNHYKRLLKQVNGPHARVPDFEITNTGEGVEKREPCYTVGGNVS